MKIGKERKVLEREIKIRGKRKFLKREYEAWRRIKVL
jgi:hypothetical protein